MGDTGIFSRAIQAFLKSARSLFDLTFSLLPLGDFDNSCVLFVQFFWEVLG
jgi:hypothetical protein